MPQARPAIDRDVSRRRIALITHVMDQFERDDILAFTEMFERYLRLVDEFIEQQTAH